MTSRAHYYDPGYGLDIRASAGFAPAATVAPGATNGAAIQHVDPLGEMLPAVALGIDASDLNGATTAYSVSVQAQTSADGSTGWADLGDPVVLTGTNAAARATGSVDLHGSLGYVRFVRTVATDGTSLDLTVCAAFVQERRRP